MLFGERGQQHHALAGALVNSRLWISGCVWLKRTEPIGNRQLAIANQYRVASVLFLESC